MPTQIVKGAEYRAARAAVAASAATRRRLRGKSPADRDEQLRSSLEALSVARAPITAVLRSGPLVGRQFRHPELRALSTEIQAERAKVRGMLRRASGGRRKPTPAISWGSFKGEALKELQDIARYEACWNEVVASRAPSQADRRKEAVELLEKVASLRRRMRRTKLRYAHAPQLHRRRDARHMIGRLEEETARLERLQRRLRSEIAKPLYASHRATKAVAAHRRRRWTAPEAFEALQAFADEHGRPARKSDLHNNPDLPSYTKLRDLFGGMPDLSRGLPGTNEGTMTWTRAKAYDAVTRFRLRHGGRMPTADELSADPGLPGPDEARVLLSPWRGLVDGMGLAA